jgi:hypothetical protein
LASWLAFLRKLSLELGGRLALVGLAEGLLRGSLLLGLAVLIRICTETSGTETGSTKSSGGVRVLILVLLLGNTSLSLRLGLAGECLTRHSRLAERTLWLVARLMSART